jgi:hypothetical protein
MTCARCGGFAVPEGFQDCWEDGSRMWFRGWRCLNCGCIEDSVIRANRRQTPPPRQSHARMISGNQADWEWV